jgi:hypothetical protein
MPHLHSRLENGRAFSLVINESTGMLSAAVARDGKSVGVFGACTPMPSVSQVRGNP